MLKVILFMMGDMAFMFAFVAFLIFSFIYLFFLFGLVLFSLHCHLGQVLTSYEKW